jgi:outer membrane protein
MIRNVLVGACVLSVLAAAGGQARGQSLSDVLILAYRGNPDLTYQRAQVDGAKALVDGARAPGLPQALINGTAGQSQLSLDQGGAGGASDQDQTDSTLQLTVSQVLYAGGRISQDTRRAKATAEASQFDLIQTEQLVLGQAITAYVDILRDEAILSARNQNVEALLKQSAGVRARLREGEVTKTDVAQTEARLAQARSGAQAARANLAVSRAAFTRIVGQPPESLSPAPPLPGLPGSAQEAQLAAEQDTPSVKAAQLRRSASEAAIRRAAAERLPYVTLDATAGQDRDRLGAGVSGLADSVQREDSYGLRVNVRVPLFQGGATSAGVRQARAVERGAQASEDSAMRQAKETAANAWNRMQAADAIIDSSSEQAKAAEVAYRGGEYELNAGLRSTFDVLDLQQDVLSAQIAVASAQRDAYVARVNLLQSVGRLTLQGLGVSADGAPSLPATGMVTRPAQALAQVSEKARAAVTRPAPPLTTAGAASAVRLTNAAASRAEPPKPPTEVLLLAQTPTLAKSSNPSLARLAAAPTPTPAPATSPQLVSTPKGPQGDGLVVTDASSRFTRATLGAPPNPRQTDIGASSAVTPAARANVATPAAANACAVQAGAFAGEDVAHETQGALEQRFASPPGARWVVEPTLSKGRRAFRVLLVGLDGPDAAREICDRLGRSGHACFVRLSRCAVQAIAVGALAQAPFTPSPRRRP